MALTLRPTVVVGFGSSGSKIVSYVQQNMYEVFKRNSLPIFKYIAIETDRNYSEDKTPEGSDVELIKLDSGGPGSFDHFDHLLDKIEEEGIRPPWIDRDAQRDLIRTLRANGNGAGNARLVGRLLLWANMKSVYSQIELAQREVRSARAAAETERLLASFAGGLDIEIASGRPNAIVCGTLTGGSFSGAFIDLGYVCQDALQIPEGDTDSVHAIALMPPAMATNTDQLRLFKANAYGALLEWDHFQSPASDYDVRWPGIGRDKQTVGSPFSYLYAISQEYNTEASKIKSVSGLYELSGLKVFCDLIGLLGERSGEFINHFSSKGGSRFLTFGMAAILHPRYQLSEYVACEAGERLCARWLDPSRFLDEAGRENPVPDAEALSGLAQRELDGQPADGFRGLLNQALNDLEARESRMASVQRKVEDAVQQLTEDEHYDPTDSLLSTGDTFYDVVRLRLEDFERDLNAQFEALVRGVLERTQNFPYAIAYAKALQGALADTLAFWRARGVPETHADWNTRVTQHHIPTIERSARDGFEQVRNYLARRELTQALLYEAVDELKLHLTYKALSAVRDALGRLVADELEADRETLTQARGVLAKRMRDVDAELRDDTLPIARVWSKGSLEGDVAALRVVQPGASHLAGSAYDPDRQTTWMSDALRAWRDGAETPREVGRVASEGIKLGFQREVLRDLGERLPVDLLKADYKTLIDRYFKRGHSGHLRFDPFGLGENHTVNQYLVGRSDYLRQMAPEIAKQLANTDLGSDHFVELPGMDHMVLYYREMDVKGTDRLKDIAGLRESFQEPPLSFREENRRFWTPLRIAYDVPRLKKQARRDQTEREATNRLRDLFLFVSDFFMVWEPNGQAWEPTGVRAGIPLPIRPAGGDPPVPTWVVQTANDVPRPIALTDRDGAVNESAVREVAQNPARARSVLTAGADAIRALGADRIRALWTEGDRPVMTVTQARLGDAEFQRRLRFYFGDDEAPGFVREALGADWLAPVAAPTQP